MSRMNEGPAVLEVLRKRQRPTEPRFRGSRLVTCRGCGAKGSVNLALLAHRQWTIDECVNCR